LNEGVLPMSLKDRKEAILDSALELFAERGFPATTTAAVAKKAGVAEGLIFHYFKNKEGIFVHILEGMMDTYIQGIEAELKKGGTGLEAVENIVAFHFRFNEKRSTESQVLIRDFPFDLMRPDSSARDMIVERSGRIIDLIKRGIQQGKKDGSIRDLPQEKSAFIVWGMVTGLTRLQMSGAVAMPRLGAEVVDFCRQGMGK
jgi:AcrR family transcriptional regulator